MKSIRKAVSVLLVTVFSLSIAGCFLKSDVPTAFEKAVKSYGIEKVEKRSDLTKVTAKLTQEGSGYYVTKDDEEATKNYKSYFGSRKGLPDCEADDFRIVAVREKGESVLHSATAYTLTFKHADDAKEVYDVMSKVILKNSRAKGTDQGEKNGYSYALAYEKTTISTTVRGFYYEDKSITVIQGNSYKNETNAFVEHFCKKMNYISPADIIED